MKQGYLSQYFKGVAAKVLSAVEVDVVTSNQHEFNGVSSLKKIFGNAKKTFPTTFVYLNDNDDEPVTDKGFLTWYDARERHPKRTEFRMYFPSTLVSFCAAVGDTLFIGLRPDDTILVIITESNSTIGNQLRWLFGLESINHPGFSIREELESDQDRIAFASRFILEQIGIEIEESSDTYFDEMLKRFNGNFPTTKQFSSYAQSTLIDLNLHDNPDVVLMAWMEREEILFRTLEKYLIGDQLTKGFHDDVDGFIKFSLSVQNRRKSRVGQALENHIEQIFTVRNIHYTRTKITENKSKPDFIFPSIEKYHDKTFDGSLLTMLGVKSTCKDRWRQVLSEANRIKNKNLLTLEAAISENQTNEMIFNHLQLVVPQSILITYTNNQQKWLINLDTFITLVKEKQNT